MRQGVAVLSALLFLCACSDKLPVPVPSSVNPLPSIAPSEQPASQITPSPTVSPSLQPTALPTPTPIATLSSYPVEVVAGSGQQGFEDGPALQATFHTPRNPCLDKQDGSIYIPDNHMLRKLTPEGQVTTVAGGQEAGYKDGPALDARFDFVSTCVVEPNGDVLIGDRDNRRIRRLTRAGEVSTFLGTGKDKKQDGPQAEVSFTSFIIDMELLQNGDLYILDEFSLRLWKDKHVITLNKNQDTLYSPPFFGSGDGKIATGVLGLPAWMTADSENHLYFADETHKSVRKLSPEGHLQTISISPYEANEKYGVEPWTYIFTVRPIAIAFDASRNLLFVCGDGSKIYASDLKGKMNILVGNILEPEGESIFSVIGSGGLVVGADHDLYVIDAGAHQVKRIRLPDASHPSLTRMFMPKGPL